MNYHKKEIPRVCENCKKPFLARKDQVAAGGGRFCSRVCGTHQSRWKGGRLKTAAGYIIVYTPGERHRLEHRVVMEQVLGRRLQRHEVVHHKNGDKSDNRPENLELMEQSQHIILHNTHKPKRWAFRYDCCQQCGTTEHKHGGNGLCGRCYTQQRRKEPRQPAVE